ncbi:hypothetical protein KAH81_07010, partial [bacterium]|nr:hypothetical protein [bacterium]
MMKRVLFVLLYLVALLNLGIAKPLEINNLDVNRVGVELPAIDPNALFLHEENLKLDGFSELFTGELGWEVHCRLDTGAVDIVFCIDSSGSMSSTISSVRASIGGLISSLESAGYDYHLGGITYADGTNLWDFDGGTPGNQMTANSATFTSGTWLGGVGASGGADGPEQSLDAIGDAIREYDWRPDALRIIIGFTDASYCQVGDGCSGYCNPGTGPYGSPATETDTGIASLISSTGTVIFWASRTSIYASCGTYTSPVPAHPPWTGTGHLGWYQYFAYVSGGKWYDLSSTSWSTIFSDVSALISTFMSISVDVTNNSGTTINPIIASLSPGACISVLSSNPISYGPVTSGSSHHFYWRIDYDSTCSGPALCFDISVAGGGYADTAVGCL